MRRATATFVLVCAVLGVFGACTRGAIQSGEARLTVERGRVRVLRDKEPARVVTDDVTLRSGDRVKVLAGDARMRLPKGNELWLRTGTDVTVGSTPRVNAGEAVALGAAEGLSVDAGDATAVVRGGASRVRVDFSMSAANYRGSLRVATAGRELSVPALRSASVAAIGRLPVRPSPLGLNVDDPWDRHFLGLAIELTADLDRRSEGFTAQLAPGQGRSPGFYRLLFPELDRGGIDTGLLGGTRAPGDTLVGAAIAVGGERGSVDQRLREVFSFRDDGAAWGLVALDQAVRDVPGIRRVLIEAIGRLPGSASEFAAPAPPVPDGPSTAPSAPNVVAQPGSVPSTVAPPVPPPVPRPTPPTVPTPVTVPPVVPAPDTPVEQLLEPVGETVETVGDLVGGLLG